MPSTTPFLSVNVPFVERQSPEGVFPSAQVHVLALTVHCASVCMAMPVGAVVSSFPPLIFMTAVPSVIVIPSGPRLIALRSLSRSSMASVLVVGDLHGVGRQAGNEDGVREAVAARLYQRRVAVKRRRSHVTGLQKLSRPRSGG